MDYRDRFRGSTAFAGERENTAVAVVRLPSDGRLTPAGLGWLACGLWRRRRRWHRAPVVLLSVGAQMVFLPPGAGAGTGGDAARGPVLPRLGDSAVRAQPFSAGRWRGRFYARAGGFGVTSLHVESLLRGSGLLPAGAAITLAPCALPTAFVEQAGEPTAAGAGRTDGEWRVLTVARLHPRKGQLDVARALGRLPTELRGAAGLPGRGGGGRGLPPRGGRRVPGSGRAGRVPGRGRRPGAGRDLRRSHGVRAGQPDAGTQRGGFRAHLSGGVLSRLARWRHTVRAGWGRPCSTARPACWSPRADEAALAAAIRRLLEDGALRERLGRRGREFARSFRWEDAAAALCATARNAFARR